MCSRGYEERKTGNREWPRFGGKVVDVQNEKWTQDPDTTVCWQQAPEDLKLTGGWDDTAYCCYRQA